MHQLVKSMVNWNMYNDNIMTSGVAQLKNSRSSPRERAILTFLKVINYSTLLEYSYLKNATKPRHIRTALCVSADHVQSQKIDLRNVVECPSATSNNKIENPTPTTTARVNDEAHTVRLDIQHTICVQHKYALLQFYSLNTFDSMMKGTITIAIPLILSLLLTVRCSVAFRPGPWRNLLPRQNVVATSATSSTSSALPNEVSWPAWKTDLTSTEMGALRQTAEAAARAAGQVIVENLGCASKRQASALVSADGDNKNRNAEQVKTSIKDIVTEHDKEAQIAVESIIRGAYPDHSFLGEESVDPGAEASEQALTDLLSQTKSGFLWICDPIDGTANFASGLSMCAVTVSVVYKGTALIGVVYDPHAEEMFTAVIGQGATVNGEQLTVATGVTNIKDSIINAGCPADPNAFAASMRGITALNSKSRGLRMMACSALTTAWIAAGRLTAHFGYDLSSWDLVAGALLIQEAGGLVTDLDGSPYRLETRNMLCSNGEPSVHNSILQVLKDADATSFTRS